MAKPDKEFQKYLTSKKAKEAWEKGKSEAKGGGFPQYDDGRYKVQWVRGSVGKTQKGEWMAIHEYKFLSGEYKNKPLKKWFNLENDKKIRFLVQDLSILGHEDADLDALTAIHEELNEEKPTLFVSIKTNGEFQNTWLNNIVEGDDDEEDEESEGNTDADSDEEDSDNDSSDESDDDEDSEESDDDDEDESESDEDADEDSDDEDEKDDEDESDEADEDEEGDDDADESESDSEEEEVEEKPKKGRSKKQEEETENVNITKGMKLKLEWKKKITTGTVLKVDDAEGKCIVKLKDGTKVKIGADAIKGVL